MKRRRGKVVLCGYIAGLADLACARALDRSSSAQLIVGPGSLPAELRGPEESKVFRDIDEHTSIGSNAELWDMLARTIEAGENVLRWYPDNPLAMASGRQDVTDLVSANIVFEIVPSISPEIVGATFVGVPLPSSPRSVKMSSNDDLLDVVISHGGRGSQRRTRDGILIAEPGTPRQRVSEFGDLTTPPETIAFSGTATEQRVQPGWFESLPLFGKRVMVTRPRAQAPAMTRLLREHGAETIELPAIEIVPDPYPDRTRQAIEDLPHYDWVIFTSANGVEIFLDLLLRHGYDARRFGNSRIATIGSATAERLRAYSLVADFVPDEFVAEAIVEGLQTTGVNGRRVLLPRAEVARDALPAGLREIGASVDVVPVYRTIPGRPDPVILDRLDNGEIEIVTFTSSSTVTNLMAMLDGENRRLARSTIACVGPVTADTARDYGLNVEIVPEEYSVPGLVDAICTAMEEAR